MDKHNNQQKNKSKNTKKHPSLEAIAPVSQEQSAAREDPATLQGKKSSSSTSKKK